MSTPICARIAPLGFVVGAVLVLGLHAPSASAQDAADPERELAALDARYEAAEQALQARYRTAKTDAELEAAYRDAPWKPYALEYAAFARAHARADVAVPAWAGAIERSLYANSPELVREALETVEREHLASPRLALVIAAVGPTAWSFGTNRYEVFLRRAAQESPHRAVQGFALYALAESLGLQTTRVTPSAAGAANGAGVPDIAPIAADEFATRKAQACALLTRVLADFADTPPASKRLPKTWVKDRAEGLLFELQHLQVGMTPPDFEATDEQGAKWKLSDYRGRVVLLDFWGNW